MAALLRLRWRTVPRMARLALVVGIALVLATPARAAGPLGLGDCGATQGVQQCSGLVATWDGVPLDTTVTLPSADARGLPLVVELNGFGNSKQEYLDPSDTAYTDNAYAWARDGYAVLTYTARGLWGSCGTPEARAASPAACARGYIHLADVRYEVRDAQELIGRLVDEGFADAARIGVTGDSYGGGQSMDLAALRDRVMLPDGRLVPWRSPNGTSLRIAAAAPVIPWTDLVYAIAPNGRSSANGISTIAGDTTPVGVFKASVANAIFAAAQLATGPGQPASDPFVPARPEGYVAPAGTDPDADVTHWVARSDAGEPYTDGDTKAIVDLMERFHSAYGIDDSSTPPPLFVGAGFTDDIFPVDETLRFVNRMRRDHSDVPWSLLFGDFGHQRAANKKADRALLVRDIHAWFDHYLRGQGAPPPRGVAALTQTCPHTAPSGGPFAAPTFAQLAQGEVRYGTAAPQTLNSSGGDPTVARAVDPVAGGGDDCAQTSAATAAGTATYLLPAATGHGYTLLGAPAITARLAVSGDPTADQVQARLWDVAPGGASQTLVARGTYRPTGRPSDSWELHANGWRFAAGHVPKLELLGNDAPYGRPSNQPFQITVEKLDLRLPVRERLSVTYVTPDRSCVSRRHFRIRLPRRRGDPLRSARVAVDGRLVRVLHGRRLRAIVDLRGLPRGLVRVRISGRTRSGRRIVQVRRYRTCARRRPTR